MMKTPLRPGMSLIEVLLFVALLSATIGVIITLLITANENRIRQQALAGVEQNGVQLMQTLSRRIRSAERIMDPPIGKSGSVLTVQMPVTEEDPTIVSLLSGAIVVARHDTLQTLTATQVTVLDLVVRNTSTAANKPSVFLSFTLEQEASVIVPVTFQRSFEALITLFPDDEPEGNPCGCALPVCSVTGVYTWRVCEQATCSDASNTLRC